MGFFKVKGKVNRWWCSKVDTRTRTRTHKSFVVKRTVFFCFGSRSDRVLFLKILFFVLTGQRMRQSINACCVHARVCVRACVWKKGKEGRSVHDVCCNGRTHARTHAHASASIINPSFVRSFIHSFRYVSFVLLLYDFVFIPNRSDVWEEGERKKFNETFVYIPRCCCCCCNSIR